MRRETARSGAKGPVMGFYDIGKDTEFGMLQDLSQHSNLKLHLRGRICYCRS